VADGLSKVGARGGSSMQASALRSFGSGSPPDLAAHSAEKPQTGLSGSLSMASTTPRMPSSKQRGATWTAHVGSHQPGAMITTPGDTLSAAPQD